MRTPSADYQAVTRSLLPHQLKTLEDYAASRGASKDHWAEVPLCAVMAVSLAVGNEMTRLSTNRAVGETTIGTDCCGYGPRC